MLRKMLALALLAAVLAPPTPAQAATNITINGTGAGRIFDGAGAVSGGGGNSKLLFDYAEPQRSQILDYLFKPGYGANIQHFKVEIGGGANSTSGAEKTHMYTATDQNYQRGYEWWLMNEAKRRNPNIRFGALAWAAPGWIGTSDVWTSNFQTYLLNWLRGARDTHGLTIDNIGGWNENAISHQWFVNFRAALNANGFASTKLVGADGGWWVVDDMASNAAFRNAIDVVGVHYPCDGANDASATAYNCPSPQNARDLGKPLWASENGSLDYQGGADRMARQLTLGYVDGRMTAYINWPLIAALPPGIPFQTTGLVHADEPWSGWYNVGKQAWTMAHLTQVTQPGWQYLDGASGLLSGNRAIGSYTTLKAPGNTDYSTIIETSRATSAETFTATVTGGLPNRALRVYSTDLRSNNPADWFVRQSDITPSANNTWSVTLQPGRMYSISTVTTAGKGTATGNAAAPFPANHADTFDSYGAGREARYLADQHGSFETVACGGGRAGGCVRQMAPVAPIPWHPHQSPPYAVIGDGSLTNYTVQSDVMFEQAGGSMALIGRFGDREYWQVGQLNAYYLKVGQGGAWQILRGNTAGAMAVLASGTRAALSPDTWHTVALRMQGTALTAIVDGVTLGSANDGTYGMGPAGLAVGVGESNIATRWRNVQFDNLSITPGTVTTYRIVNRNSGKVLSVAGGSTADGAQIVQLTDTGAATQRWRTVASGGYVQIVNVGSGKALDVPGFSTANGTQFVQWTANTGANQQWTLGQAPDGYNTLVNRHSTLVADVSGASTADGAAVIQWPAHTGTNQQWQLVAS